MEQLYSLRSAALKLDISVRTLRRLLKKHNVAVMRVGSRIRVPESELEKLILDDRGKYESGSISGLVDQLLK